MAGSNGSVEYEYFDTNPDLFLMPQKLKLSGQQGRLQAARTFTPPNRGVNTLWKQPIPLDRQCTACCIDGTRVSRTRLDLSLGRFQTRKSCATGKLVSARSYMK